MLEKIKNIEKEVFVVAALLLMFFGWVGYEYVRPMFIEPKVEQPKEENPIIGAAKYYRAIDGLMSDTMSIEQKVRVANLLYTDGKKFIESLDSSDIKRIEDEIARIDSITKSEIIILEKEIKKKKIGDKLKQFMWWR